MSKRDRHNQKRRAKAQQRRAAQHRAQRPPVRPSGPFSDQGEDPDLVLQIREALAEEHPLSLLALASSMIVVTDPPPRPMEERSTGALDLQSLIQTFLDVPLAEISVLALAIDTLRPQPELLSARIRGEVASRPHRMPDWLTDLDNTVVTRSVLVTHVLGDGDNVMLDLVLPEGHPLTVLAFIDHNMGHTLKDAFPMPMPLAEALALFEGASEDPVAIVDIDPADARATMETALQWADRTLGMPTSESWPSCRPLLEWSLRLLPEGGRAPEPAATPEEELDRHAEAFLASPLAATLPQDPATADIVDQLLFYTSGWAGDPLRWSPTTVEILLLDWAPRKIMAGRDHLARVPAVAAAMLRWAHAQRDIPAHLTEQTAAAVADHTQEYLAIIDQPRRVGPMALLERMGVLDDDEGWVDPDLVGDDLYGEAPYGEGPYGDGMSVGEFWRRQHELAVGGPGALAALRDDPLPDEPLDTSGLADADRDRARAVADLTDRWCDAVWDVEHRTACRRLITETQRCNPATLRRGKITTAAAAICWLVGQVNDTFNHHDMLVRDLTEHFGVSGSPGDRARTIVDTLDMPPPEFGLYHLGSPDFLVGRARRDLLDAVASQGD